VADPLESLRDCIREHCPGRYERTAAGEAAWCALVEAGPDDLAARGVAAASAKNLLLGLRSLAVTVERGAERLTTLVDRLLREDPIALTLGINRLRSLSKRDRQGFGGSSAEHRRVRTEHALRTLKKWPSARLLLEYGDILEWRAAEKARTDRCEAEGARTEGLARQRGGGADGARGNISIFKQDRPNPEVGGE
jgi:hypothetical protein